jgi:hypothetical protein
MEEECKHEKLVLIQSGGSDYNPMPSCEKCGAYVIEIIEKDGKKYQRVE